MFFTAVTGALVIAVLVLGAIVWRLVHLERQRSEARIAALAAAVDDPHWTPREWFPPRDDAPAGGGAPPLFTPPSSSPSRLPLFAVAGLTVVVSVALLLGSLAGYRPDGSGTGQALPASLELLSMQYVLDGDTLTVSGLVRNASGSRTPPLTAAVSAFDRQGQIVARGSARLDPVVLDPGKETPFRVDVTPARDLGRYRLSFLDGDRVVPHVDRRGDLARAARMNN